MYAYDDDYQDGPDDDRDLLDDLDDDYDNDDFDGDGYDDAPFADPGGNSALRAASARNPRNLPCPQCERPDMLTPADVARHYVCDRCARQNEGWGP